MAVLLFKTPTVTFHSELFFLLWRSVVLPMSPQELRESVFTRNSGVDVLNASNIFAQVLHFLTDPHYTVSM